LVLVNNVIVHVGRYVQHQDLTCSFTSVRQELTSVTRLAELTH